jgi:16S rRNA (guanine966-N2)-methyltransferase
MTRIIAGIAKGRQLAVPKAGTRPTSDRVRESVFSSLNHDFEGDWSGVRVLDLFAGTGAFGLEALSRGAAAATAVELHPETVKLIQQNAEAVKLPLQVQKSDVKKWLSTPTGEKFDLIFLDPPYDFDARELQEILDLVAANWVADSAIVLVERSTRNPALVHPANVESDDRKFGDTTVQKLVW